MDSSGTRGSLPLLSASPVRTASSSLLPSGQTTDHRAAPRRRTRKWKVDSYCSAGGTATLSASPASARFVRVSIRSLYHRRCCCLLTHRLEDFDQLVLVAAAAEERSARHHLSENAADADGTQQAAKQSRAANTVHENQQHRARRKGADNEPLQPPALPLPNSSFSFSPPNVHLRRVLGAAHQHIRRSGRTKRGNEAGAHSERKNSPTGSEWRNWQRVSIRTPHPAPVGTSVRKSSVAGGIVHRASRSYVRMCVCCRTCTRA